MRIFGITLLFLSLCGAGILPAYRMQLRHKKLESAMQYIERITEQMRINSSELPVILSDLKNDIYIKDGQWHGTETLKKRDLEILQSFLFSLGTTDINGQIKNTEIHISLLRELKLEAKKEREEHSKLYVSLGFLSALFVCVLLV